MPPPSTAPRGSPGAPRSEEHQEIAHCPTCGSQLDPSAAASTASIESSPGGHVAVFRREGEYWLIAYEREACRLKDTKGLGYLAALLGSPGQEVLALHLAQSSCATSAPTSTHRLRNADGLRLFMPGDTGEILDASASAAYEQRIRDLQDDLDEAETFADSERVAQLAHEMDFLVEHLAAATGLAGHTRRTDSPAERARQSVTKAIKSAANRIAEHSPALGRHLASTLRTGTYCIYDPDPRVPITWRT